MRRFITNVAALCIIVSALAAVVLFLKLQQASIIFNQLSTHM